MDLRVIEQEQLKSRNTFRTQVKAELKKAGYNDSNRDDAVEFASSLGFKIKVILEEEITPYMIFDVITSEGWLSEQCSDDEIEINLSYDNPNLAHDIITMTADALHGSYPDKIVDLIQSCI